MEHGTKLGKEGAYVTLRTEKGSLLAKAVNRPEYAKQPKRSWRAIMLQLTDGGIEQLTVLRELSLGTPLVARNAAGQETEPIVPSPEVRRAAAKDLLEFMHGKAVAQTEVAQAEAQHRILEQVQALSDQELEQRVRQYLTEGKEDPRYVDHEQLVDATPRRSK